MRRRFEQKSGHYLFRPPRFQLKRSTMASSNVSSLATTAGVFVAGAATAAIGMWALSRDKREDAAAAANKGDSAAKGALYPTVDAYMTGRLEGDGMGVHSVYYEQPVNILQDIFVCGLSRYDPARTPIHSFELLCDPHQ